MWFITKNWFVKKTATVILLTGQTMKVFKPSILVSDIIMFEVLGS